MEVEIRQPYSADYAARTIIVLMLVFNMYPFIDYMQYLYLGNVYFKINYIKVIGFFIFTGWVVSIIHKGSFRFVPNTGRYHLLYVVYCLISAFMAVRFDYPLKYIVISFATSVLWFVLMLPFSVVYNNSNLALKNKSSIYNMSSIFIFVSFLIAFILGLLQHFFNDLILPAKLFIDSESEFPYFAVMSYEFFGRIRAFGYFDQPIGLGLLSTLVANMALSRLLFRRRSLVNIILFGSGVFGVYITYIRMCYITLVLSLLVLVFIWVYAKTNLRFLKYNVKYLPLLLFFGVFTIIIYGYIKLMYSNMIFDSSRNILDLSSMVARYVFWNEHINTYILNGNIFNIMFGYGIFQGVRLENFNIIVDNSYLMTIIYQGLFGLLIFLLFYFRLWSATCQICLKNLDHFEIAVTSYLSTFLATAMYANIMYWHNIFFFLLPLIIIRVNYDLKTMKTRQ